MSDVRLIYMTASNEVEAERIGRALVEERLAACVNILGSTRSIYLWQGDITTEQEVAFIAKSRADLVESITERVIELHSYACPCIVTMPIDAGNSEFLMWIKENTS